jgi:hypothetical protein
MNFVFFPSGKDIERIQDKPIENKNSSRLKFNSLINIDDQTVGKIYEKEWNTL